MVFGGRMTWAVILKEGDRRIIYAKRIAVNRCFSAAADLKRVIPSRTARSYRMSGANGCQERHGAKTQWSGVRSGAERIPVFLALST